jgi:hypothetical protein
VTVEQVVATIKANVSSAKRTLKELVAHLPDPTKSVAHAASRRAVITAPEAVTDAARARLGWLLG